MVKNFNHVQGLISFQHTPSTAPGVFSLRDYRPKEPGIDPQTSCSRIEFIAYQLSLGCTIREAIRFLLLTALTLPERAERSLKKIDITYFCDDSAQPRSRLKCFHGDN
jgi:hypothetical protein